MAGIMPPGPEWFCQNPECKNSGLGSAPDKCPKCGGNQILGLTIKDGPQADEDEEGLEECLVKKY